MSNPREAPLRLWRRLRPLHPVTIIFATTLAVTAAEMSLFWLLRLIAYRLR